MPLEVEQSRFRKGSVDLPNELKGGSFQWIVYVFAKPRGARQYMFWSMASLYDYFRMKSYAGSSSIWVSRSKKVWCRSFTKLFGCSQLIEGTSISGRNQSKTETKFVDRCLPEPAVSSLGLLSLLIRWSEDDTKTALKACDHSTTNAADLLVQLVNACCQLRQGETSWCFTLVLDSCWKPAWPAAEPLDDGSSVITLAVNGDGTVDLEPWRLAAVGGNFLAEQWWAILESNLKASSNSCLSFGWLMTFLGNRSMNESLFRQFLYACSLRLERLLGFNAKLGDKMVLASDAVRFVFDGSGEKIPVHQQPYRCAAYVYYAKTRIQRPRDFGIATDKGWAHGLPLCTTIMTVPSNFGAVAPPVVASGVGHLSGQGFNV